MSSDIDRHEAMRQHITKVLAAHPGLVARIAELEAENVEHRRVRSLAWATEALADEVVLRQRARIEELKTAMVRIHTLAGEAALSVETLAAFSPLTMILTTASDALNGSTPSVSVTEWECPLHLAQLGGGPCHRCVPKTSPTKEMTMPATGEKPDLGEIPGNRLQQEHHEGVGDRRDGPGRTEHPSGSRSGVAAVDPGFTYYCPACKDTGCSECGPREYDPAARRARAAQMERETGLAPPRANDALRRLMHGQTTDAEKAEYDAALDAGPAPRTSEARSCVCNCGCCSGRVYGTVRHDMCRFQCAGSRPNEACTYCKGVGFYGDRLSGESYCMCPAGQRLKAVEQTDSTQSHVPADLTTLAKRWSDGGWGAEDARRILREALGDTPPITLRARDRSALAFLVTCPNEARIPSPYRVDQEVEARFEGPRKTGRGVIRRITTFPDREAFHIVEMSDGEYGFGTQHLSPCSDKPQKGPTIELPIESNDDEKITCVYCRRETLCEYVLTVLRPGEVSWLGIHAACLEPLKARNPYFRRTETPEKKP